MQTYISLFHLTRQGIRAHNGIPAQLNNFEAALQQAGGRLIAFYLVMGQYDFIMLCEAPDDQTAARLILTMMTQEDMHSQTMRAFSRTEFESIVQQ